MKKSQNIMKLIVGITAYTYTYTQHTQNYSNFKSTFSFNNESIFEIHNYFRSSGNVSVHDLSELINILSNQHFTGLDNFNKLENLFST